MGPAARTPALLILDDSAADRARLRALAEELLPGARVGEAATWAAAREVLGRQPPDVLLLDFCLPDAEGLTVLDQVREEAPRTRVVVVTGAGSDSVARQFLRAGAFDYLAKDELTSLRLQRVLDQALEQVRLVAELDAAREAAREIAREAGTLLGPAAATGGGEGAAARILRAARAVLAGSDGKL